MLSSCEDDERKHFLQNVSLSSRTLHYKVQKQNNNHSLTVYNLDYEIVSGSKCDVSESGQF